MPDAAAQRRILRRHFFGAFMDNDLISPGSDLHGVLAKFAALLVLPGVMYPVQLLFKYTYPYKSFAQMEVVSWSDKSVFVTLSLIVMGLVTALEWDALQLDRRDGMVFGALPIGSRTIAEAKLLSLGALLLIVSGGLAAVGGLSFPLIMHARWPGSLGAVAGTVAGHAAATIGAAAFSFFALLSANGLGQLLLGPAAFRRASAVLQMLVTFALAVALLMLPMIAGSTATLKAASAGPGGWAPQMWFVGIYQWVSGYRDPDWTRLAARGAIALGIAAVFGLGTTLLAYRRLLTRAVDAVQAGRPGRTLAMRAFDVIGHLLARDPVERGFFSFTIATLFRSAWHRVTLAAFFGGALALSIAGINVATFERDGVHKVPAGEPHLLFVEFLIVAITLAGVRAAAASPAELKSAWVLQLLQGSDGLRWRAGFRKAVWASLIVPLVALLTVCVGAVRGWDMARTHAVAQVVFAAVMLEVLLFGFARVPFACAFDGATGSIKVRWMALVAFLTTTLFSVAQLVVATGHSTRGSVSWLLCAAALTAGLRIAGNRGIRRAGGLRFDADDDSAQTLGLSG